MADDVILRFSTRGAATSARDVERITNEARKMGLTVEQSSVRASAGLDRASKGMSRLVTGVQSFSSVHPVLGQMTAGLDQVGKGLGRVESDAMATGGGMARITAGANVATAALVGLAIVGVKNFVKATGEVRQFQRVSGAGAEEASKLVAASHVLGIETSALARGVFFLGRNITTNAAGLAKYGVEVAHTRKGTVDLVGTLYNVSAAYTRLQNQNERNTLAQAAFGRGGVALIPILQRGRAGLEELFKAAERSGMVFNDRQLEQGKQFSLTMREVEEAGKGLAISLGAGVVPAVTQLMSFVVPLVNVLTQTGVVSAVLAGLLARQLVVWLIRGGQAVYGMVASFVRLIATGSGTAATLGAVATAEEIEAVAAAEATAATTALDIAMAGIPLVIGTVIAGLTLFRGHSGQSKAEVEELSDAISKDTQALYDNSDALASNTAAWFQNKFKDHAGELRELGLSFEDVRAAVTGSDKDFAALIAKLYASGGQYRDLGKLLSDVRGEYGAAALSASDFAAAGGQVDGALASQVQSLKDGAAAASWYAQAINTALDTAAAPGNLEAEQKKLADLLKNDGTEEYAKRQRDLTKAQNDATKATRARESAERKLDEVNKRSLETERQRAATERDRANLSVEEAQAALGEAQLHEERVKAAGGSDKVRQDADRKTRDARTKVAEATDAAREAEANYNDVASGAALERDRADAVQAVADARSSESDATAKVADALKAAKVPASELGSTAKEIADQLNRVVQAGLAANASLIPLLDTVAAKFPQIAAAVQAIESAIKGAIYGPGDPFEGVDYYASGGQLSLGRYVVGERGPEVLDMYGGGSGYVYPNHHPLTKAVLGRASGGAVGASVRGGDGGGFRVIEVGKSTHEGDFTGPIIANGLTLEEVRREARREGRRRANSRVSRGR